MPTLCLQADISQPSSAPPSASPQFQGPLFSALSRRPGEPPELHRGQESGQESGQGEVQAQGQARTHLMRRAAVWIASLPLDGNERQRRTSFIITNTTYT